MKNLIFALITIFLVVPCAADIITVDDDGPADFNNIQAAIDDSNDGDIIVVGAGTYTGEGNRDIDFLGKAITVRSTGPNDPKIIAATIIDCNGRWSDAHRGFYFHNNEGAASILSGLTITNGHVQSGGGAIVCEASSPTIANCTISGNGADEGGGMYNIWASSPTVSNCTFYENEAFGSRCRGMDKGGGAMHNSEESSPKIYNCTFAQNYSGCAGGAIFNNSGTSLTVTNCVIRSNSAPYGSGGIFFSDSHSAITNCTFVANELLYPDRPGASALACGGTEGPSDVEVTNCILWDDANEVWNFDDSDIGITYSDVRGGWSGEGNIDAEPCFAFDRDYHLMAGSPCIDRGTNAQAGLPTTDRDGNPRLLDGDGDGTPIVDMGASEYNPDHPAIAVWPVRFSLMAGFSNPLQSLLIKDSGGGTLNWQICEACEWLQVMPTSGVSTGELDEVALTVEAEGLASGYHGCALTIFDKNDVERQASVWLLLYVPYRLYIPGEYDTIQAAIDAAYHWEALIVAPGIYTGEGNRDLDFKGKRIIVRSIDPTDPNIVAGTIIDCNGTKEDPHRGFWFHSGEGPMSIVDGLTITRGYAPWDLHWSEVLQEWWEEGHPGGGIYCGGAGPTIRNCIIASNRTLEATFGGFGGGIYASTGPIINCVIKDNSAQWGGGIYGSTSPIINCTISYNSAHCGGGLCECPGPIRNCLITRNSALAGGGVSNSLALSTLTNCTIVGNFAQNQGGAVVAEYEGSTTITNCILWGNEAARGPQIFIWWGTPQVSVRYSNLQGGERGVYVEPDGTLDWGEGNIDIDPCFVVPGYWDANGTVHDANDDFWVDGDYHLRSEGWRWDTQRQVWTWDDVTSRCIDAGNPGSPLAQEPLSVPYDPDNVWGQNLRINMGAYGGTPEASMPPYDWALLADLNNDGTVDFLDLAHWLDYWLSSDSEHPADLDRNAVTDMLDYALFAQDWLSETTWH